jgi:hypothetical protein
MRHVGTAGRLRRERTALAIGAGGLAAVAGLVRATAAADLTRPLVGLTTALLVGFGIAAAALAALAFVSSSREDLLKIEIEHAAETVADRGTFAATLSEIGLGAYWSRRELTEAIFEWAFGGRPTWGPLRPYGSARTRLSLAVRRLVRILRPGVPVDDLAREVPLRITAGRVGPADFASLVIAKGLERDWIEEVALPTGSDVPFGYRMVQGLDGDLRIP